MSFSKNQTSTIKYHTCFIFLPVGIVKSHVTNHPTGVRREQNNTFETSSETDVWQHGCLHGFLELEQWII